jgi:hypothetical protein
MHSWRLEFEMMMHGPRMNVKPEELFDRSLSEKAFLK